MTSDDFYYLREYFKTSQQLNVCERNLRSPLPDTDSELHYIFWFKRIQNYRRVFRLKKQIEGGEALNG